MRLVPTLLLGALIASTSLFAEESQAAATQSRYTRLRSAPPDPAMVAVAENLRIDRPGLTILFKSGRLALLNSGDTKSSGAVFSGDGVISFTPTLPIEKQQIQRYARGNQVLVEPFSKAVIYFAPDALDQILKQGKFQAVNDVKTESQILDDSRDLMRETVRMNVEAEMLRALEKGNPEFIAVIFGRNSGPLVYSFAPTDQEQVTLLRVTSTKQVEVWNSWSPTGADPTSGDLFDAVQITVDSSVSKNANLAGKAVVQFKSLKPGYRVIPFLLAGPLRVSSVEDEAGNKLAFVQESEKRDSDLWVIGSEELDPAKTYTWTFNYAGKDVIRKAGAGNYFVGQRTTWFPRPRNGGELFSDRVQLKLKFDSPKGNTLVATGKLLDRKTEGDREITEWESEGPATVGGFNYGNFVSKTAKNEQADVTVYTNRTEPDELAEIRVLLDSNPQVAALMGITSGGLTTTGMAQTAAQETANCMAFYTWAFGALDLKHIAVTQQPSSVFGQSWPGLTFLPYTAFLDNTMRHQLQFGKGTKNFLEEVGPHEVAHQWWGHELTWKSYRDQWISEGFAEYSAALYLERTKGVKRIDKMMEDLRLEIVTPGISKYRPNDYGPITLGTRLSSEEAPGAYRLVYSKGAYVLHMLRMMMRDFGKSDDSRFLDMMRDFYASNRGKAVSTEDFLAVVSKHAGGDMTWFFNQWVYGTEIPKVDVDYKITQVDGKPRIEFNGQVTGAQPGFTVVLPVRMTFKQGVVVGRLKFTTERKSGHTDLPDTPSTVEFNPFHAILADVNARQM